MEYHFIGWCREGNSDKVWVCIRLRDQTWATVWGRRGKKLQHKVITDTSTWDIEKLENSKFKKGYKCLEKVELDTVYPEFEQDLEKTTMWAMLRA
jgi:predicted DNA-binding WGR domain protein